MDRQDAAMLKHTLTRMVERAARPMTVGALLLAGAGAALAGPPAWAPAHGLSFDDRAVVRDVQPQYERVNVPRRECRSELVPERRVERGDHSLAGPIFGGIVGGLIGSQFGRGEGRVASAAVGAMAGAITGEALSDRPPAREEIRHREVQRCHQVDQWESRLSGYRVTYEYAGRLHTTVLPFDPGAMLAVQVSVAPDPARERRGRGHGVGRDDPWSH
jgi:uncharacterized protein YcfJ